MACQGMKIILNLILLFIWFPGFPGIPGITSLKFPFPSLPVAICEFPFPSRKTGMWFSISLPVPGSQKAFPAHPCHHPIVLNITMIFWNSKSQPYRTEFLRSVRYVFSHPNSEHFMCIFNRWALQGPLDFNRYSLQRKSKFGAFFLNFTIQWRWCFCNQNSTKWPKMTQNGIVPLAPEILLAPKLRWTCHLRGSHGLSARRAWKTKSSRPEGPKEWPKATS